MTQENDAIEIKVGALVLVSLVLLGAFVFVLGDVSFSAGKRFHVRFENAGGLKPGADVAIAGLKVGQVESLSFIKKDAPKGSSPAVTVRATIAVQRQHADSIRKGSNFYISTRSVLGEPYIEVVTPSLDAPPLEEGATVTGNSPPRVDLLVSKTSKLLDGFIQLFQDPNISIDEFFRHTASLIKHVDKFFVENRGDLDHMLSSARDAAGNAANILAAIQFAVGEGKTLKATFRDFRATLSHSRAIAERVDSNVDPLTEDVTKTAENVRSASRLVNALLEKNDAKLQQSITDLRAGLKNFRTMSSDGKKIVASIENGQGTVGRLLQDRKLYDDLREVLRIIKRQPWKIMWKE